MNRLHSLKAFCRVVELQGFAAAARDMGLAPSAVTRLINELEAHVGVRLINRTTRRMALTEAGEAYLERVRRILSELEEAEASVRSSSLAVNGVLKVVAPSAFATSQIAPLLVEFRRRYPALTVSLSSPGLVESLDANFDVSLIASRGAPGDGEFVARQLACSDVILCAAPAYIARFGPVARPADLMEHELLTNHPGEEMVLHPDASDPAATGFRFTPKDPPLTTGRMDIVLSSALAGLCIVPLPSYAAAQPLAEGRLVRVLPGWRLYRISLHAAMPTRKYVPAKTRAFLDYLFEVFPGGATDPWAPLADAQ